MFEVKILDIVWKNGAVGTTKPVKGSMKDDLITEVKAADTGRIVKLANATDDELRAVAQFFTDLFISDSEKQFNDKVIDYRVEIYYSPGTVLDKVNTRKVTGKMN